VKAKVGRGNGFRGLLAYVFGGGEKGKHDRASIVGGNMAGMAPRDLAAEFAICRRLRPNVKSPVWHCSLALPKGERLDGTAWERVCARHLQLMGIDTDNHMWVAVQHDDTDYDHVHLVVSRIGLDATLWHGRNDVKVAIESTQAIEREFGLRLTPGLDNEPEHPKKTRGEAARKKRKGQVSVKERMQAILNKAMQARSFEAFVKACQSEGLELLPNVASTGRMSGFSFRLDGELMKASDLGAKYRWAKLATKTGYDSARHMPLIQEMAAAAVRASTKVEPGGEASLRAVKVAAGERPMRRNRTIDLLFIRLDDGTYAWKRSQTAAFRDLGDRIRFGRAPDTAIKAALQLVREKGWVEVEAAGSIDFRRRTWIQGRLLGIRVVGYEPSRDDMCALAEHRCDGAVRIASKEVDPLIRQILILKAETEANLAKHWAIYGEIPAPEIGEDTIRPDQYEFAELHADEQYRQAKLQASTSRAALREALPTGLLAQLRGGTVAQARSDNALDWAAYLAHCHRVISSATAGRLKLAMEIEDLAFWLREIQAGRMPIELQDAIDGEIEAKPHAAAVATGLARKRDTDPVKTGNVGRRVADGCAHWSTSEPKFPESPEAELPGNRLR